MTTTKPSANWEAEQAREIESEVRFQHFNVKQSIEHFDLIFGDMPKLRREAKRRQLHRKLSKVESYAEAIGIEL